MYSQPNWRTDRGNIYVIAHRDMNVKTWNEAAQFHFGEYSFPVLGTVSLQCIIYVPSFELILCVKVIFIEPSTENMFGFFLLINSQ
jgi:hypothetical protein